MAVSIKQFINGCPATTKVNNSPPSTHSRIVIFVTPHLLEDSTLKYFSKKIYATLVVPPSGPR